VDQSRRAVLQGSVVAVVAGAAGYVAMTVRNDEAPAAAANAYGSPNSGNASSGKVIAKLSEVPPDGGVVLSEPQIVVTRSGNGDVRGFSAVCTHQGCLVSTVRNGLINCPCHGSSFDAVTGQVVSGPAQRPLPPVAVRVSGDSISA
jgi:Rieske Fe-S protein